MSFPSCGRCDSPPSAVRRIISVAIRVGVFEMSGASLEDRVAALESQMALLLKRARVDDERPGWQRALGRFTSDEIMQAIDKAAIEYREEDRRKFKEEYDAEEGR